MNKLSEIMRPSATHPQLLGGSAKRIWERELLVFREKKPFHLILWGPPGCGKTTLAQMIQEASGLHFTRLSAVRDGVKEIRENAAKYPGQVLFIDEIHRLTKSQQDVLLPIIERDECFIIGATTENPSTAFVPALLSRIRLSYLSRLSDRELLDVMFRGLESSEKLGMSATSRQMCAQTLLLLQEKIAKAAAGDVRYAWNLLETLILCQSSDEQEEVFRNLGRAYTSKGHYDYASAMIKSMRGSDPDAALYYAFCALDSGEDLLFLLRRCIIFASEDVSNADPQALNLAVSAKAAAEFVGLPEARIALAQIVTYLSSTVKSNRSYVAIETVRNWRKKAEEAAAVDSDYACLAPPPELTLKGASEYRYPHDHPGAFVAHDYLPRAVSAIRKNCGSAYIPSDQGFEMRIKDRLEKIWKK